MASSEAHKRAAAKWMKENNERLTLVLNKNTGPTKEQIKAAAARDGMPVNGWIIQLIRDAL